MPIFAALGAKCTVLDYSEKMLEQERIVAQREGYNISILRADMTKRLPFDEGSFDLIFHPVSNCYVAEVKPIWQECYRVLKPGGQLFAPTFVHGEVPRTRLRMLAMRCAGLQIYNSWMVPQYLAFLQAGGFAVQEHALLGDTLAPLCYARAVPDKTRVTQR